jgi:hypothetical protein
MLKEQAGTAVEAPHQADGEYLEHPYYQTARDVYQTIHTSHLDRFTFLWVESLWEDLSAALYELESLPETVSKDLLEVIELLTDARNELRLARFLFDVEEINPVYRLVMRNRAVLRSEHILHKVIFRLKLP